MFVALMKVFIHTASLVNVMAGCIFLVICEHKGYPEEAYVEAYVNLFCYGSGPWLEDRGDSSPGPKFRCCRVKSHNQNV